LLKVLASFLKILTKLENERECRLHDPLEKEKQSKAKDFAEQIKGNLQARSDDFSQKLSGRWFIGDIPIETFVGETQS
jgi:hypothetical protein